MNLRHVTTAGAVLAVALVFAQEQPRKYQVLDGIAVRNLIAFPVTCKRIYKTDEFLTLDEGVKTGEVIITEGGEGTPMGPRLTPLPPWSERPRIHVPDGAQVNELRILNRSDRSLILLAGEIVTGGKQDRIVGKDRIIPAHGEPVSLDVFCVEPHRWVANSSHFNAMAFTMAQPSVRGMASGEQNQVGVWDRVAKAQRGLASVAAPTPSSSYAVTMSDRAVQEKLDTIARPTEEAFDKLRQQLQAQKAVGAVIAINNRLVWLDVFASPELFERYWPKLVRSYAAEAITGNVYPIDKPSMPTRQDAQEFLDNLPLDRESIETDPGVYRSTEITGPDFRASFLTSLEPGTGFLLHLAKMRQ